MKFLDEIQNLISIAGSIYVPDGKRSVRLDEADDIIQARWLRDRVREYLDRCKSESEG